MNQMGAQIHTVVKNDPLELGAVKLDVGVWAHPSGDEPAPGVNSLVFVVYNQEEDKWYWIGTVYSVEMVGYNKDVDWDSLLDMYEDYEDEEDDLDDADWWKQ